MSMMRYISFPKKLTNHQVSYIRHEGDDKFIVNTNVGENWGKELPVIEGQVDGRVSIWDFTGNKLFNKAVFINCFMNPYIYGFSVEIPDYYREQCEEIIDRYSDEEESTGYCLDYEAMDKELSEYVNKKWFLKNQVLYKYLQDNLKAGEFVEIYESWIEEEDERGMIFGPPTSETVITLNELPNLPFSDGPDEVGEREKLTIHKV